MSNSGNFVVSSTFLSPGERPKKGHKNLIFILSKNVFSAILQVCTLSCPKTQIENSFVTLILCNQMMIASSIQTQKSSVKGSNLQLPQKRNQGIFLKSVNVIGIRSSGENFMGVLFSLSYLKNQGLNGYHYQQECSSLGVIPKYRAAVASLSASIDI